MFWKQIKSFARPVAVLAFLPFVAIAWPLSIRWQDATVHDWHWLAAMNLHGGIGAGLTHTVTWGIGLGLLMVGLWWFWWPVSTFIRHGLTLAPEDEPDQLVTWGPFRHCTHPMFFGVLCISYAEGFLMTPWVWVLSVAFTIWLFSWYLPYDEEPKLLHLFGKQWIEYSHRTFHGVLPIGLFNRRYRIPRRHPAVIGGAAS
jgi:protein-S-isoprenylcysteine O-methyltransferase Ste14